MTTQTQTIEETKSGTKRGQHVQARAATDQLDYWKNRVRYREFKKSGGKEVRVRNLHARIKHAGDEGWFNLGTDNRLQAGKQAAKIYAFVKVNGWDAANARFKPKPKKYPDSPTLGKFFETVEEHGGLNHKTFVAYCRKFRGIAAEIFRIQGGPREKFTAKTSSRWRAKVDALELASVTPEAVKQWKRAYVQRHGTNPLTEKRARHTADSAIRSAKALFSKNIRQRLDGFHFPSPLPFEGVTVAQVHNPYQSQINHLDLCQAADRDLRVQHPEAYKIFLLSLHVGLRRNEVDKLRWESINWVTKRIQIQTTADFSAKTAGSEASVPMNDVLVEALRPFCPPTKSGYVISSPVESKPKATYNHYRANRHQQTLIKWLRSQNVNALCPIHTLRKELGSILNDAMDVVAAQRMLRHKDPTTTARYYTAVKRDIGDVLTSVMKANPSAAAQPAPADSKPAFAGQLAQEARPSPTGVTSEASCAAA